MSNLYTHLSIHHIHAASLDVHLSESLSKFPTQTRPNNFPIKFTSSCFFSRLFLNIIPTAIIFFLLSQMSDTKISVDLPPVGGPSSQFISITSNPIVFSSQSSPVILIAYNSISFFLYGMSWSVDGLSSFFGGSKNNFIMSHLIYSHKS